jgi:HPt (histidine-containing phosphotransfer) domain-containing protein
MLMKVREIRRNRDLPVTAGESAPHAPIAVLDAAYLDAQIAGDLQLREELLRLYAEQLAALAPAVCGSAGRARREAAHKLKGASFAIGAFALARLCDVIESDTDAAAGRPVAGGEPLQENRQRREAALMIEATRRCVTDLLELRGA